MTDTAPDVAAIRAALADVKPAEWMHLFGDRFVYDRMEDGCRGLPMAGVDYGPPMLAESKRLDYIAACHPERIARLLDALEAATKDAQRYRWLRNNATIATPHIATPDGWKHFCSGADEIVDAAMKATP